MAQLPLIVRGAIWGRGLSPAGRFPTGGDLPLWTGTSEVPVSERFSLPDPERTFNCSKCPDQTNFQDFNLDFIKPASAI